MIAWLTAFIDGEQVATDFWTQVTAATLSPWRGDYDEFATLVPHTGDAFLRVQRSATPVRVHLDLHVADVRIACARAEALGARQVADLGYLVMASPTGLPLCLVPWHGESTRPEETVFGSLVDQVCLDVDAANFDRELGFWRDLSGWPVQVSPLPEFAALQRPPGLPLRLLFQRRDSVCGDTTAHLDIACVDRAAEVDRHLRLGATKVRSTQWWTTLRDPAGLEYCLTDRDPITGVLAAG